MRPRLPPYSLPTVVIGAYCAAVIVAAVLLWRVMR